MWCICAAKMVSVSLFLFKLLRKHHWEMHRRTDGRLAFLCPPATAGDKKLQCCLNDRRSIIEMNLNKILKTTSGTILEINKVKSKKQKWGTQSSVLRPPTGRLRISCRTQWDLSENAYFYGSIWYCKFSRFDFPKFSNIDQWVALRATGIPF